MATFFNVSNHPSVKWSPEQRQAALELIGGEGDIQDVPFPFVRPEADDEELDNLAVSLVRNITYRDPDRFAAMVSGEYALTVLLLAKLTSLEVPVFVATTKRVSTEKVEGGKTTQEVIFKFVQFRKLPRIQLLD
jgi:hypothetical protein